MVRFSVLRARTGVVLQWAVLVSAILLAIPGSAAPATDELAAQFADPPNSARPQVWWHWMSGNVTTEGVKLDLEWMHRVGVGGVHAFSGGKIELPYVEKPLTFMSPGWNEAYHTAVTVANGYGMEVTIAGSPGWSETGAPWVPPADGMKKYVWTETRITGAKRQAHALQPLPTASGPFQVLVGKDYDKVKANAHGDSIVVAFPAPRGQNLPLATYSSNGGAVAALAGAPIDLSRAVTLNYPADRQPWVDVDFGRSVRIGALSVASNPSPGFEIRVSSDGKDFRAVGRFAAPTVEESSPQQTVAFPEVRGRVFRVVFDRPIPHVLVGVSMPAATALQLRRLEFLSPVYVDRWEAKAGFQPIVDESGYRTPNLPADAAIAPDKVIDLTSRLKPDGSLDWSPPAGSWIVLRLGWSLTGSINHPAEPKSIGLEVDKLDRKAVDRYVNTLFDKYKNDVGAPLGKGGIEALLTDSWESGSQNWTPSILSEFKRLRGYDPTPWIPVLTGRVVRDAASSDAFLFDFRRTLKDLIVEAHYKGLAEASHARGMKYYTEVNGDAPRVYADDITAKAASDIPTGEIWYRPFYTGPGQPILIAIQRATASAAHVYGKPLVAAEGMTVAAVSDPWAFSPAMLKPVADEIFALGVNRFLIHESHMQPFVDKKPGLKLQIFGQFFNRNDTWADEARPWTDYLARTSFMLQQGRYVADVAYFYGEEKGVAEIYEDSFNTDVPSGFAYDYVDPQAVFSKLAVRDGNLVTASGMNYRVLYIPSYVHRMTLPMIRRLADLVRQGAVLVGRKPVGGLGLQSPDSRVKAEADKLWGNSYDSVGRTVGLGRIYNTSDLAFALRSEGARPDISAEFTDLMSIHRRTEGADIYFVSNREVRPVNQTVRFRVTGRAPEFWSAEDGRSKPLSYRQEPGVTAVTLPLEASGAGFVVFRKPADAPARVVPAPRVVATNEIVGDWLVRFEPGRGAPNEATFSSLSDWSANSDAGIRYFSGAATYSQALKIDPAWLRDGGRIMLNLGDVRELAVVYVDGKEIATAWHPPYRVDLTEKVGPGRHRLEIKVVNLWANRLIGDKQPGATPVAYAPQSTYQADSPLRPSGLLGPVRLELEKESQSH